MSDEAIWTELSGDDAIEAILAMIDEEIRSITALYRRCGFPDYVPKRYQEIRDKIDSGDWKDFRQTEGE